MPASTQHDAPAAQLPLVVTVNPAARRGFDYLNLQRLGGEHMPGPFHLGSAWFEPSNSSCIDEASASLRTLGSSSFRALLSPSIVC